MRSSSTTCEHPQIEPKADVANKGTLSAADSLRLHWPEYLMEAGESGLYLFSACAVATLLWHPASPLQRYLLSDPVRRMLMGLAMGAIIIVMSFHPGASSPERTSIPRSHSFNYAAGRVRTEKVIKEIRHAGGKAEAVGDYLSILEGINKLIASIDQAFGRSFGGRLDRQRPATTKPSSHYAQNDLLHVARSSSCA